GYSCPQPDLFEFPLTFIDEKKVGARIISHEQIDQPIIVHVCCDCSEGFAGMIRNSGFFTHISEFAVAFVMKKAVRSGLEQARDTIIVLASLLIGAESDLRLVIINET